MRSSSKTKDPDAAFHLMQYIFTDGMVVFMENYLTVPPIKTFYDDPAWRELPAAALQQPSLRRATKTAMVPTTAPLRQHGRVPPGHVDGIDAVILGQMSVEDAVNNMAEEATLPAG